MKLLITGGAGYIGSHIIEILINKKGQEFARIIGSIDFEDKNFVNWMKKYN